jgi:hypothetical protein
MSYVLIRRSFAGEGLASHIYTVETVLFGGLFMRGFHASLLAAVEYAARECDYRCVDMHPRSL